MAFSFCFHAGTSCPCFFFFFFGLHSDCFHGHSYSVFNGASRGLGNIACGKHFGDDKQHNNHMARSVHGYTMAGIES